MSQVTHLLNQKCHVAEPTMTGDIYGRPTYGTPVEIRCAVLDVFAKVRDIDGNERISSQQIVSDYPIKLTTKIWLPGEDTSDQSRAHLPISTKSDIARDTAQGFYHTFL